MTHDQIIHMLDMMSLEELSYTIGRYTGPQNWLLSEKKFGVTLQKELVQHYYDKKMRAYIDEQAEKYLLGNEADKIEE